MTPALVTPRLPTVLMLRTISHGRKVSRSSSRKTTYFSPAPTGFYSLVWINGRPASSESLSQSADVIWIDACRDVTTASGGVWIKAFTYLFDLNTKWFGVLRWSH